MLRLCGVTSGGMLEHIDLLSECFGQDLQNHTIGGRVYEAKFRSGGPTVSEEVPLYLHAPCHHIDTKHASFGPYW